MTAEQLFDAYHGLPVRVFISESMVSEYVHGTMAGMSVLVARIDATLDEVK